MVNRLVELINQAVDKCTETKKCEKCVCFGKVGKGDACMNLLIATHLLSNGVIAPPCKKDDVVYIINDNGTDFVKCKIVSTYYDGVQWFGSVTPLFEDYSGVFFQWREYQIGKTMFLTKKEAEISFRFLKIFICKFRPNSRLHLNSTCR